MVTMADGTRFKHTITEYNIMIPSAAASSYTKTKTNDTHLLTPVFGLTPSRTT